MNTSAEFFNPLRPDIGFDSKRIQSLLEQGLIDIPDADFLGNVANEAVINPEVVDAVNLYRTHVGDDLQPGQDLFIRMQKLGLKSHPLTGLDISGYHLPEVDLNFADFGSNDLYMCNTVVNGNVYQGGMVARFVDQSGMKAEYVDQEGMEAEYVDQYKMKVAGNVIQNEMEAEFVDQEGMEAESVDQRGMKARNIYQEGMDVKKIIKD